MSYVMVCILLFFLNCINKFGKISCYCTKWFIKTAPEKPVPLHSWWPVSSQDRALGTSWTCCSLTRAVWIYMYQRKKLKCLIDLTTQSLVMKFQHLPTMFRCQKRATDIQVTYCCESTLQGCLAVPNNVLLATLN